MDPFQTPLVYLKGAGQSRAEVLKKELGLANFENLLRHFPFRYIDRTRFYKIKDIQADLPYVQVLARIVNKQVIGEKHTKRLVVNAKDDTGVLELVWFKGITWIEKTLIPGQVYVIFGKPGFFNGQAQMAHPEMEAYTPANMQRQGNATLQPVYNSTEKLKQFQLDSKGIQKLTSALLGLHAKDIRENLPLYIVNKFKLINRADAYRNIHFPADANLLNEAILRLKFEELFLLQLKLLRNKLLHTQKFKGNVFNTVGHYFNDFYHHKLPFPLTGAQKRVLKEIRQDTQRGVQMNRLLQGDVGSGKTVVALMSMLIAVDNGFQTCIMAPTEILATQHYQTITSLVGDDFIEVALLTGSTKQKNRKVLHERLESGDLKILIGTHALIEDKVQFKNLGFVVIDEQHRFGVKILFRRIFWS
jgi:ATP-dependent DNA helicase RecG